MPKSRDVRPNGLEVVEVLYDTGDDGWSVVTLRDPRTHQTHMGMRWNGDDKRIGYPSSRGHPCWMAIPEPVAEIIKAAHSLPES